MQTLPAKAQGQTLLNLMTEHHLTMDDLVAQIEGLAPEVLAFLRRACGDDQLGGDLAQEALVKALRSLHQFKVGTSLKAWVFRIAWNAFQDQFRKKRPESLSPSVLDGRASLHASSPIEGILDAELARELTHQMSHLPERQRAVLLLHGVEELSHDAIANILEINKDAVKTALYHGRRALGARMERYLDRKLDVRGRKKA
jgi:RNA polymerase sigma-70 factor (ECF subfamily)